jgi:hypothetical protein
MAHSVPRAFQARSCGCGVLINRPRTHSESTDISACAGYESRQAPAFRLHEQVSDSRLRSGCESFVFAISLVARSDGGMSKFLQTARAAPALLVRPRRDGVGGAPV